jgi:DNA adenine methylase
MREGFPRLMTTRVINVASVPQRSPFRYPGGKTWLVPYVRLWLSSQPATVAELVEPFAGGAIVALTAVFEDFVKNAVLIEKDPDVAAVWRAIFEGRGKWLAHKVASFTPTPNAVRALFSTPVRTIQQRAFATIVRNRVQRGGIMAPGAGLMKLGENGRGITSRWYPQTLRRRILDILAVRNRIEFIEGDGLQYIEQNIGRRDQVYFIDPPYTVAGRRLYRYSEINHRYLFQLAKQLPQNFLMTYDRTGEIHQLATEFGFDCQGVAMKNTHNARMTELLIGKSLDWLRSRQASQLAFQGFLTQTHQDLRDGHQ